MRRSIPEGWFLAACLLGLLAIHPLMAVEQPCQPWAKPGDPLDPVSVARGSDTEPNENFVDCVRSQFAQLSADDRAKYLQALKEKRLVEELVGPIATARENLARDRKECRVGRDAQTCDRERRRARELYAYEGMRGVLIAMIEDKADPLDLKLDFYVETRYSSLYDPDGGGALSTSKPGFVLEISQALAIPRDTRWHWANVESYGYIGFREAPTETQTFDKAVTTAQFICFEGGLVWRPLRMRRLSIGFVGAAGVDWFSKATTTTPEGIAEQKPAWAKSRLRFGGQVRQEGGVYEGTLLEIAYLRDPVFANADRLLTRGRLVVSPTLVSDLNGGLGVYIEGLANVGSGRDEVAISVGVRVDAIAVLKAVAGLAK